MLAHIFASKYLHIMEARRDVFQAIADPTTERDYWYGRRTAA